jgi:prepilin-type N-terminal cleavage/methylation domain-containing protein
MSKLFSKIMAKLVGRESGFTLTELAVAMLVVGILASVAVPSFLGSRNNAYDKEAQNSINLVMNAALGLYQNQGDFSDASTAGCGSDAGVSVTTTLAADLQKIEPNIDVIAAAVASSSARTVSVDARRTYNSNAELLGCQAFFATALSSSGTCWIARFTVEGKFFQAGSIAPIVMAPALNTQNYVNLTWTLLQANGAAYAQIRARSNAADADNTQTLALTQSNCNAKFQSTGLVALQTAYVTAYYANPSEFYSSWRDTTGGIGGAGN